VPALPYASHNLLTKTKDCIKHREPHSWRNIIKLSWAFSMMSPLHYGTVNQEPSTAQLTIFIPGLGIFTFCRVPPSTAPNMTWLARRAVWQTVRSAGSARRGWRSSIAGTSSGAGPKQKVCFNIPYFRFKFC